MKNIDWLCIQVFLNKTIDIETITEDCKLDKQKVYTNKYKHHDINESKLIFIV